MLCCLNCIIIETNREAINFNYLKPLGPWFAFFKNIVLLVISFVHMDFHGKLQFWSFWTVGCEKAQDKKVFASAIMDTVRKSAICFTFFIYLIERLSFLGHHLLFCKLPNTKSGQESCNSFC